MRRLDLTLGTLDRIAGQTNEQADNSKASGKTTGGHVLVVGDLMLDKFVYGEVSRISPEAPIPVLAVKREDMMLGGSGNVVSNLVGLRCGVTLVSVTGVDDARARLDDLLATQKGLDARLVADPTRPTSIKVRYLAGHQQLLRADAESLKPIDAATEDAVIAQVTAGMLAARAVILSDYGKGVLTPRVIRATIDAANAKGVPVLVDPKGNDYSRYKGADVVTPNKKELAEATSGMATATNADIEAATAALLKQSGITSVVATRSADGMSLREGLDGAVTHLKTLAREVFDVSGAGDTVIATIAAALSVGADLVTAACLANAAGGLVVEKVGTAAIRHDELKGFLLEEGHLLFDDVDAVYAKQSGAGTGAGTISGAGPLKAGTAGKTFAPILNWQDAADQVARWKARGLKVGFTNGAFDILHHGHVTNLDKCRAACDRLVVGLNCDASIKRYKSADRPINPEHARASVLAALQSTDMVVIFGHNPEENDTPLALMKALRPDAIFKGNDYSIDQVVGADFVQSYGGEVILIPLEDGFSTTSTIKKMSDVA